MVNGGGGCVVLGGGCGGGGGGCGGVFSKYINAFPSVELLPFIIKNPFL